MFINEEWLEDILLSFKFYLLQWSHKDIFWQNKGLVGLNWKVWGHGIRNGTIDSCWSRPFLFSSSLVFAHNTSQYGLVVLRISWLYFFHISIFVISSLKHYICVSLVDLHSSVLLSETLTTLILDGYTKLRSVKGRKHLIFLEKDQYHWLHKSRGIFRLLEFNWKLGFKQYRDSNTWPIYWASSQS